MLTVLLFSLPLLLFVGFGIVNAILDNHPKKFTEEQKHAACLRNIAKLERELVPDLPRELWWVDPGPEVTAHTTSTNFLQMFSHPQTCTYTDAVVQAQAQGILESAAYAEAMAQGKAFVEPAEETFHGLTLAERTNPYEKPTQPTRKGYQWIWVNDLGSWSPYGLDYD